MQAREPWSKASAARREQLSAGPRAGFTTINNFGTSQCSIILSEIRFRSWSTWITVTSTC